MKSYFGWGLVLLFLFSLIFFVRAEEGKILFKNGFSKNQIYIEPPGLKVAKRPAQSLWDNFASTPENSSISLHPGWPKTFAYKNLGYAFGWPGPVRMVESDLDGDGKGETVITMQYWDKGVIFKENGDILKSFALPQTFTETFSLGDIDNNKKNEIVASSYKNGIGYFLNVFNWLGNPIFDKNLSANSVRSMPIVVDLNNDLQDEIIAKLNPIGGKTTMRILDGEGHGISEFTTRTEENVGSIFAINPVVGNFDHDTDLEIVVPLWHYNDDGTYETHIEIYNLDGTPVPGWENVFVPKLIYNPVCGDFNRDGLDEIVACGWDGPLFIFASDGQLILNKDFSNGTPTGSPAIGDINNDGKPEIVFPLFHSGSAASLLAITMQGEIILKKEIPLHAFFSPVIGDMDGDGIPDIVFGNDEYICAFNWQGKDIGGFPIRVNGNGFFVFGPGPSICDIDHDGKIEITYTKDNCDGHEFSLYILDTDIPYKPTTMEWPMHQHDPGHSGRYGGKLINLVSMDLQAERREIRAFSILRHYGKIQFTVETHDVPVSEYRVLRRQGDNDFVSLETIASQELQNNKFQMQDKYLEKGISYTYRVEAYNVDGQLVGRSAEKTI